MRRPVLTWMALLAACGGAPTIQHDYAKEPDPRRAEYVIGVADGLSINVWKSGELSTNAVVRPDGMITMPLIGDIRAVGRTPTELREDIRLQLGKYLRDEEPVVTIAVTGVNSYSFTVSGNVEKAGVFGSNKYVTVVEAVQLAGGPNRYASPERTKIFRRDKNGVMREIPVNYEEILAGRRPEANVVLLPGDRVFVP